MTPKACTISEVLAYWPEKRITKSMDAAVACTAKNKHIRLFAGEFCTQAVPDAEHGSVRENRLSRIRFIREKRETKKIPWHYYFSEKGCKVYDIATVTGDDELIKALFR